MISVTVSVVCLEPLSARSASDQAPIANESIGDEPINNESIHNEPIGEASVTDAPRASVAEDSSPMDTIVVTASRSLTPLLQVPQSVALIAADDFQAARQGLGVDEALNQVPGVFFQNRYNFAQNLRISTRGFG
ncbi:MAG: hypothetical protein RI542_08700, partial [Wenzhouxiangella sp.]|nr:hypothetical protein [Wenzhouxiangella sp.]